MSLVTSGKFLIQRGLRSVGWELRRFELAEMDQLNKFLTLHGIKSVLDVGANIGQFGSTLRAAGYAGHILSFEPQSDAHAKLVKLAEGDSLWSIAPRCAVGAKPGQLDMNISKNSVSSSALPILEGHTSNAPDSRYVRTETVPVITLDSCALIRRDLPTFLKIDTQGFEQYVLDGATELLKHVKGLQLELSVAPLYEGQADFLNIIQQLKGLGFDIWALSPGFSAHDTGRLLQADATFFRSGS
jgi:FkbM family methyltransferase